eukprot:4737191-Prymnesium_polylepis.1
MQASIGGASHVATGGAAVVAPSGAARDEANATAGMAPPQSCAAAASAVAACGCDAWRGGDGARRAGRAAVASGTA